MKVLLAHIIAFCLENQSCNSEIYFWLNLQIRSLISGRERRSSFETFLVSSRPEVEELALFRWEFEGPHDQPGERGRQVHVMKRFTFGRADGRTEQGEGEGEGTNESLIAFKGARRELNNVNEVSKHRFTAETQLQPPASEIKDYIQSDIHRDSVVGHRLPRVWWWEKVAG